MIILMPLVLHDALSLQCLDLHGRIARLPQYVGGMLSLGRRRCHHFRPILAGSEPGAAQRDLPVDAGRTGQPRNDVPVRELVVTVIYNLFGWPFTSMVPVIGQNQLGLGPEGIGILASMDGIGAFGSALLLTIFLRPSWYARAYLGGVAIYMVMLIIFALVPSTGIASGALLLTGLGGAGFSTMQATLVYLAAPPEMRSGILGVLSMCIGTGPIGFIALGLLADEIGAQWATAASGAVGLVCLALSRPLWQHI
jgi:MFS family permease